MAEMPAFPVIVTHLEDAPGSGLAACSGRPFRTPGGFSNFARWLCTGCARYARPATGPAEDSCPCGHTDNEHVHYCSADVDRGTCSCNVEYARLAEETPA